MKKLLLLITVICFTVITQTYGASKSQEINVIVWDDALTVALESKIPDFEKLTGIKVNLDRTSTKNIVEKIAVNVSFDSTQYDLVAIDEGYVAMFADLMIPYEEWPQGNKIKKVGLNEVIPAAMEAGKWDGKNMGLPVNGNVYLWLTRKDLMDKYKIKQPQTFDDLLAAAKVLKSAGIYGFAPFTPKMEGTTCEAIMMFEAYGTSVMEFKGGKYEVTLNEAKAVQAINMYKELLKYSPPGAAAYGHAERLADFGSGKVFSMFIWPSQVPPFEKDGHMLKGKILYSAPPAGPVKRAPIRGAWIVGIPKATKSKAAAAEFAYWWSSKESGKELVKAGMSPVRPDLFADPELKKDRPWFSGQAESLKYAVARPRYKKYTEVSDKIQINWIAAITNTVTPEQAVKNLKTDVQKILDANK